MPWNAHQKWVQLCEWESIGRSILLSCEWCYLSLRLLQLPPTLLYLISILHYSPGNFKAAFSCLSEVLLSPVLRELSECFMVSEIFILSILLSGREILHFADDKVRQEINPQIQKEIYAYKVVLRQALRVSIQNAHCQKPLSMARDVCWHTESYSEFPSLPEGDRKWQWFSSLVQAIHFCIWSRSSQIRLLSERTQHAACAASSHIEEEEEEAQPRKLPEGKESRYDLVLPCCD